MKILPDCEAYTSDFWHDLTQGGRLVPEAMMASTYDVQRVLDAIETLKEFEKACGEQIEGFYD